MARYVTSLLLTLGLVVWLSGYVLFVMATSLAVPENRTQKTDAIIVLTGGNFRTTTGLELLAAGMAPELMITGVNKAVTETDIRSLWRGTTPLPACCITLGHRAETTVQNAAEVKDWLAKKNIHTIRLVTSAYHLQRALQEFKAAMPTLTIIAHPVEEEDYSLHEPHFWLITFSEYNKYIFRSAVLGIAQGFGP